MTDENQNPFYSIAATAAFFLIFMGGSFAYNHFRGSCSVSSSLNSRSSEQSATSEVRADVGSEKDISRRLNLSGNPITQSDAPIYPFSDGTNYVSPFLRDLPKQKEPARIGPKNPYFIIPEAPKKKELDRKRGILIVDSDSKSYFHS